MTKFNWYVIGQDKYVTVNHRPKFKLINKLPELGVTHVVTLLCDKEGGSEVCSAVRFVGMKSIWVPLDSGDPTDFCCEETRNALQAIKSEQSAAGYFVHCSAGIHRTGMFTYALLREVGHTVEQAKNALKTLRPISAEGVGDARLEFVEAWL